LPADRPHFERINLIEVLKSTLLLFGAQCNGRQIKIEERYSSPAVYIQADGNAENRPS